jgi:diaminopimelate epimerase
MTVRWSDDSSRVYLIGQAVTVLDGEIQFARDL